MHRGGIQSEERPTGRVLGRKISLHRRRERRAPAQLPGVCGYEHGAGRSGGTPGRLGLVRVSVGARPARALPDSVTSSAWWRRWGSDINQVREACCGLIDERVEGRRLARDPRWNEPVVGSEGFVREVAGKLGRRRQIEVSPVEPADRQTWQAREVAPRYSRFSGTDRGGRTIASGFQVIGCDKKGPLRRP